MEKWTSCVAKASIIRSASCIYACNIISKLRDEKKTLGYRRHVYIIYIYLLMPIQTNRRQQSCHTRPQTQCLVFGLYPVLTFRCWRIKDIILCSPSPGTLASEIITYLNDQIENDRIIKKLAYNIILYDGFKFLILKRQADICRTKPWCPSSLDHCLYVK